MSAALAVLPSPGPDSTSSPRSQLLSAALYPLAPTTRSCYGHRLSHLLDWLETHGGALDRATVDLYLANLQTSLSAYNQTVSAIKRLATAAADQGLLPPIEATRLQSLRLKSVRGNRIGTWLGLEAATNLLQAPDRATLRGKRDSVVLGLMIGSGLRRSEVSNATVEQFVIRDGRPVLLDILGKGSRIRTIALPNWTAQWIEDWLQTAQLYRGRLVRSIDRYGRIGATLSTVAVWDIVAAHTAMIVDQDEAKARSAEADRLVNQRAIRPHDLRRTFAKLSRQGGAKLEDLQLALGHASITTTMRYVGQDLSVAACDSLQLAP